MPTDTWVLKGLDGSELIYDPAAGAPEGLEYGAGSGQRPVDPVAQWRERNEVWSRHVPPAPSGISLTVRMGQRVARPADSVAQTLWDFVVRQSEK